MTNHTKNVAFLVNEMQESEKYYPHTLPEGEEITVNMMTKAANRYLFPAERRPVSAILDEVVDERIQTWLENYWEEWLEAMGDWEIQQWKDGENDHLAMESGNWDQWLIRVGSTGYTRETLRKEGLHAEDFLMGQWNSGYYADDLDEDDFAIIYNTGYIGEFSFEWEPENHEEWDKFFRQMPSEWRKDFESLNCNDLPATEHQGLYVSIDGSMTWYIDREELADEFVKHLKS